MRLHWHPISPTAVIISYSATFPFFFLLQCNFRNAAISPFIRFVHTFARARDTAGGHCLAPDFRNVSRLAYEQQKQHILLDWSTPPARAPPPFFLKARSGVTFKVLYQYGRQYNEGSTTPGENKNHFDSLAFMSTKVERVWSTRPPFFFFFFFK